MKSRHWKIAAAAGAILLSLPAQGKNKKTASEDIFTSNCVLCHGDDGSGKTNAGIALGAHNLISPAVRQKSDAELVQIISDGKGKMPSFSKKLSAQEIREVVDYIRELQKSH